MQASSASHSSWQPLPGYASGYQLVGTGDFSGDGKADILWRSTSNGARDLADEQRPATGAGLEWEIAATGQLD